MGKLKNENNDCRTLFSKEIWTIHDCALYLQKSIAHIRRLKRERNLPYRKNGTLYFIPHEVREWVNRGF